MTKRVTGDLNPKIYTRFREFMETNNLTESQALDKILVEYFGTALDSDLTVDKQEALRRQTDTAGLTVQQLAIHLQCDPETGRKDSKLS